VSGLAKRGKVFPFRRLARRSVDGLGSAYASRASPASFRILSIASKAFLPSFLDQPTEAAVVVLDGKNRLLDTQNGSDRLARNVRNQAVRPWIAQVKTEDPISPHAAAARDEDCAKAAPRESQAWEHGTPRQTSPPSLERRLK